MTDDFRSRLDHAFQQALKKHTKGDVAAHVNLLIEAAGQRLPLFCKHTNFFGFPEDDVGFFWEFVQSKSSKEMIDLFHLIHKETLTEENEDLHQEIGSYVSEEKLEQFRKEKRKWKVQQEEIMAPEGSKTWILQKTIEDIKAVRDKYVHWKMVGEEKREIWNKERGK